MREHQYKMIEKRGAKREDVRGNIDYVSSDHFCIYTYPAEGKLV